mgnify:CR=1 FL=1
MNKRLGINRCYGFVPLTSKDLIKTNSDLTEQMTNGDVQYFVSIVEYCESVFNDKALDMLNYIINAAYEVGKEDGYNSF